MFAHDPGDSPENKDPYAHARHNMIERQLRARGVVLHSVLEAMRTIPRHLFLSHELAPHAYDDDAFPSLEGQTISQPYMVGIMTQELDLHPGQRVLEIGTGTGYQTAILAQLVTPTGTICTIERMPALLQFAQHRLQALDFHNVRFHLGDGSLGWPHPADLPFDRILITAGTPFIPPPLLAQLADPGILIAPVGDTDTQTLMRLNKDHARTRETPLFGCRFVPLVGTHAWDVAEYQRQHGTPP